MEYSELIHDLTDGTLATEKETELFHNLAQNDELRSELKQQLAIKSAIKNDYKAFTPAASSTMNIFSTVGFAPPAPAPMAGTDSVAGAATAVKSAGFWAHYGSAIVTGVVATLTTAVVAYYIFQPRILALNSENQKLSAQLSSGKIKKEIPVVTSVGNSGSDTKLFSSNKPVIKYIYVTKESDDAALNAPKAIEKVITTPNEITESIQVFVPDKSSFVSGKFGYNGFDRNINERYSQLSVVPLDFSDLIKISKDLGLTVELKKLENWFDISPTISPKNFSKFNNTSLTLLYEAIQGLQVGGELRQETFFQKFTGLNDKGEKFRYEQQPNFTSYTVILRYFNKEYNLLGIYPILQGTAGGTNVGYLGRMMGGIGYSPYPGLTFILGAEASGLFYKHKNESFNSWRYDLNYGISFGF